MSFKWALVTLFQYEMLTVTHQSIAGVTYMDNFDFEERYRDVNECNPFHWHPLHMPEHCADMYEKLIRSRIAKNTPVRIFRTREKQEGNKGGIPQEYRSSVYGFDETEDYGFPVESDSYPLYELTSHEAPKPELSPYEKMLEMVKQDVLKDPSAPSVQILPGLGLAAIYRQPISSKTEFMIKQIATAYAKAGQEAYVDYGPHFSAPFPFQPNSNKTVDMGKVTKNVKVNKKSQEKVITKHLGNGGVITVIKSQHSHKKRKPSVSPKGTSFESS